MIKVLLVEDEAIIRKALLYTIDWLSLGCTVVAEAATGEEGLKRIREHAPDIVITDICMADMSGLDMLAEGMKTHSFHSVILTGYGEFSYAQKAIALGASDYILKPIDEEQLRRSIRRIAEQIVKEREYAALKQRSDLPAFPLGEDVALLLESCGNYYVRRVLLRIKERYNERISIEQLAAELRVSTSYLSRLVKEETSMPFQTILQRHRMRCAIEMMEGGDRRIYQVAEAVGYADYKRFCAAFKKHVGLTPTEFLATLESHRAK